MKKNNKNRMFLAALAVCLIAGVLSFTAASAQQSVEEDSGGGGGTCCPESKSTCVVGTVVLSDKYFWDSGPCN